MSSILKNALFFLIYILGLHLLIKRIYKKRILILMYHGLIDSHESLEWTQLPVSTFKKQMKYIAGNLNPISLDEAVEFIVNGGSVPDSAVVVTFDDGYLSNFTVGAEILSKYDIPATVFVATTLLRESDGPGEPLWFDQVRESVLGLPAGSHDFSEMGLGRYELDSEEERASASAEICDRMKSFDPSRRSEINRRLREKSIRSNRRDDGHLGASWDDVTNSFPLISVGAHTVNHEILSTLDELTARKEIADSKEIIESRIGTKVRYFAYPNGRPEDFSDSNVEMVKETGFMAALTTIEGFNERNDDPYRLKRLGVGSDTGMIWFKLAVTGTIDFIRGFGV